jgi:hypothetical protein
LKGSQVALLVVTRLLACEGACQVFDAALFLQTLDDGVLGFGMAAILEVGCLS